MSWPLAHEAVNGEQMTLELRTTIRWHTIQVHKVQLLCHAAHGGWNQQVARIM